MVSSWLPFDPKPQMLASNSKEALAPPRLAGFGHQPAGRSHQPGTGPFVGAEHPPYPAGALGCLGRIARLGALERALSFLLFCFCGLRERGVSSSVMLR